jgi:diacylglycerol kinase (ATP)
VPRKIHVVINPASGQPQPILHTLNRIFREAKADWSISITQKSGDAENFARQAAASGADVVAAYGGDGTVMEVARGLLGSPALMAILPGGTANLMSVELGIPKKLDEAAAVACSEQSIIRQVDMGRMGETSFLLRVGMGFAARKVKLADRELKNRYGVLAYTIAAMKALTKSKMALYRITLDGETVELKGLTCLVDNAGNMGLAGFAPGRNISVSDGLLDVLLITDPGFSSTVDVAAGKPIINLPNTYAHWQARQIEISAEPSQPVQLDGEMAGRTPVSIQVIPQALRLLTPGEKNAKK